MDYREPILEGTIYQMRMGAVIDLSQIVAISDINMTYGPGYGNGNIGFAVHVRLTQEPVQIRFGTFSINQKQAEESRDELLTQWKQLQFSN